MGTSSRFAIEMLRSNGRVYRISPESRLNLCESILHIFRGLLTELQTCFLRFPHCIRKPQLVSKTICGSSPSAASTARNECLKSISLHRKFCGIYCIYIYQLQECHVSSVILLQNAEWNPNLKAHPSWICL